MRKSTRTLGFLLAFALGFSLLSASPTNAAASTYVEGTDAAAELYDPLMVSDIHIELSDENKELLYWDHETYVAAKFTITVNGVTTGPLDVGIRVKGGWGSLRSIYEKCSFRIKFNFSVPKQKFMGLKKIVLNNMVQDPTMLHESLAYRLMRAVGVSSSRTGYANVTVNDELYGIYLNIEAVDKTMLKRWYNGTISMYEGAYWTDVIPDHFWNFEVDEGELITWENYQQTDLWELVNFQNLSGDEWFNAISQVADMEQITQVFAAELFMAHWDGYTHSIWNNYYLHFDLDGKLTLIPSGMDQTWNGGYLPFVDPSGRGVLYQKCLEVARCFQLYIAGIAKVSSTFETLGLDTMASRIIPAIQESISADWKKEYPTDYVFSEQPFIYEALSNRTAGIASLLSDFQPSRPVAQISREKLVGTVSWNQVEPLYVTVVGHEIRTSTDNQNWQQSDLITSETAEIDLTPGVTTYVRVRVINVVGTSNWSSTVSVFTPHLPITPEVSVTRNGKRFDFSWSDLSTNEIEIDGYEVAVSDTEDDWTTFDQTELNTSFNLDFGQTKWVKIRSLNQTGESAWTEAVEISLPALPNTPALKFSNKAKKVRISWNPVTSTLYAITGYEISTSANKLKWSKATFVQGSAVALGHPKGITRFYRIRVLTDIGHSAWSKPIKYARK
jgi:hypothetical protein